MAVDKLVDSGQLDTDLTSVANAIRTKGGTSASLAFPAGFVSAVQAIPTGGTPTGTKQISITQNGTTTEDVTNYANAEITVNVQGGGGGSGYSFDWANVTEVTIGANSVSNTQGVVDFFSTYAPYSLIVLASALTTNNQFVSSHSSSAVTTNRIQRWKNGSINITTVGANYDCFLPQGSKYLVFVKK